jgi:hypothetical protein
MPVKAHPEVEDGQRQSQEDQLVTSLFFTFVSLQVIASGVI